MDKEYEKKFWAALIILTILLLIDFFFAGYVMGAIYSFNVLKKQEYFSIPFDYRFSYPPSHDPRNY